MKQIPSDKYNVAWFTLAECVSRGEKVRALSLYRLLVHSIDDPAFVHQLKGDLLLAFQDKEAVELYQEAAELYQKDNRFLEAVGVYEHLFTLEPEKWQYIKTLAKLYKQLGIQSKAISCLQRLLDSACLRNDCSQAIEVVEQLDAMADQVAVANAHKQLVLFLLGQQEPQLETIILHSKKVVDYLLDGSNNKELQQFLTTLEATNNECYLEVCSYLDMHDSERE